MQAPFAPPSNPSAVTPYGMQAPFAPPAPLSNPSAVTPFGGQTQGPTQLMAVSGAWGSTAAGQSLGVPRRSRAGLILACTAGAVLGGIGVWGLLRRGPSVDDRPEVTAVAAPASTTHASAAPDPAVPTATAQAIPPAPTATASAAAQASAAPSASSPKTPQKPQVRSDPFGMERK
jgi:hypothetical protein